MTIVHYKQCAGSSPRKTVLVLVFHVHRIRSLHVLMLISLPGPNVQSRASTWLYIHSAHYFSRDGAHVLIPDALKGPPTSFLQCIDTSVA